jgi:hypothetical protein
MSDWQGRIEDIAVGLLTIEVNTIRKAGMSAMKMPAVPIALHSIIDGYSDFLLKKNYGVTPELLEWAANRIKVPPPPGDWHDKLRAWSPQGGVPLDYSNKNEANQAAIKRRTPIDPDDLTNGAVVFEALRWVAAALLRDDNTNRSNPRGAETLPEEDRAIVTRIFSNCRQIVPAVLGLEAAYAATLKKDGAALQKLFNGTLDESAQAMVAGARFSDVPADIAILIRKTWDVGTELVLVQSAIQVDGDLITRVSPAIDAAQREFLLTLHGASVKSAIAQWQTMFELIKSLIGDLGKALFNR